MIGYASNESEEFMPLTHLYANMLCKRMRECFEKKIITWLQPDAKTQVTIEYESNNGNIKPIRVHTIVISTQHSENVTNEEIDLQIKELVIKHGKNVLT